MVSKWRSHQCISGCDIGSVADDAEVTRRINKEFPRVNSLSNVGVTTGWTYGRTDERSADQVASMSWGRYFNIMALSSLLPQLHAHNILLCNSKWEDNALCFTFRSGRVPFVSLLCVWPCLRRPNICLEVIFECQSVSLIKQENRRRRAKQVTHLHSSPGGGDHLGRRTT